MAVATPFTSGQIRRTLTAALFATLALGCGVQGSGVIAEERREFEHYEAVALGDGFVGEVKFGSEYSLVVEADDNLIDDVRMRVVSGKLIVDMAGLRTRNATLRATFSLPVLRSAQVTDGGVLDVEGIPLDEDFELDLSGGSIGRVSQLRGERFDTLLLANSGGGSFRVTGNAATTLLDISGGGSGTLTGSSDTLTVSLSGGSRVDAGSFLVDYLDFDLSGGSTADVEVRYRARGELSGGSVLEVGGEADIDADTSGGSVVDRR